MYFRVTGQRGSTTDYFLLAGFTPALTHKTADHQSTICAITRNNLAAAVATLAKRLNAAEVVDVTDASILKRLEKMFIQD